VFLRRLIGDDVYDGLPARTKPLRRAEGAAMVNELRWQADQRYFPSHIEVPVILGLGSESHPNVSRAAALFVEELPATEVVVVDGAGHQAPTTYPDAVAAMVRQASERVMIQ
jgi:pimeloyl-ACP methyl ester carboxylesterase